MEYTFQFGSFWPCTVHFLTFSLCYHDTFTILHITWNRIFYSFHVHNLSPRFLQTMSHDRAHLHKLIGIARAGYNCDVHGKLRSSTASSSSHDPPLHFHLLCRGMLLSISGKMETAQWRSTSWFLGPNEVASALAVPTEWCTRTTALIEIESNYALVVPRQTFCT